MRKIISARFFTRLHTGHLSRKWPLWAGALLLGSIALSQSPSGPRTTAYINGRWLNGAGFQPATYYAVNGVLQSKPPAVITNTIDLGYVVPPYGDAHNHQPNSRKMLTWANPALFASGVFYVLNPNDIASLSNPLRSVVGGPATVDIIFAHGGLTSPGGHPTGIYQSAADRHLLEVGKDELEGNAFYTIDTKDDIDKVWPRFLESKPDAVKLYLYRSEKYTRKSSGRSLGLKPEIAAEIVHRANQSGLRSLAHVESAQDFHNAIAAGVSVIMHLPGYSWQPDDTESDFLIQDSDARLAAERGVPVVTTIAIAERATDKLLLARARAVQVENLRRLKRAGVRLAIGTDETPGKFFTEVSSLASTGVFTNREILQMMTEISPALIFPERKLGKLMDGYEASFLVLDANPMETIQAASHIRLEIKQGQLVPESLYLRALHR